MTTGDVMNLPLSSTPNGTLIPCVRIRYDDNKMIEMHCFEETYADGYSNTDVYVVRFTKIALMDMIKIAKERGLDIEFLKENPAQV